MKWIKRGLIFRPDGNFEWMSHHAAVPTADKVNDEVIRIYFGPRDNQNRTVTTFIEVEADNPSNVLYVHNKPALSLGKLGCFDDSGVTPCWIVNYKNKKYLYYAGWNVGVTVPYRLCIGLAFSDDGGLSYTRYSEGPILGRSVQDPYLCSAPCVLVDNGLWKMWYLSGTGWTIIKGKPEPLYLVKYAESQDGINWDRSGLICIDYKFDKEAIGRPCVIKEGGIYKMWYSYKGSVDYRTNKEQSYRIGYAESTDGKKWTRKDEEVGIDRSDAGWDSVMIEYPYVYEHKGKKYMLYCGNKFGESGFGYAELIEEA